MWNCGMGGGGRLSQNPRPFDVPQGRPRPSKERGDKDGATLGDLQRENQELRKALDAEAQLRMFLPADTVGTGRRTFHC